jgi:hypothetical protein
MFQEGRPDPPYSTFGLPLLSSAGVVSTAFLSPSLLVLVELLAGGVLGASAFDPLGRAASPSLDADGSGVSPAKAEALVISMAAKSKLGSRYIDFSLSFFPA